MTNDHSIAAPPLRVAWFVWGAGALLYLMGFFHRVAPAVMTSELMREFGISAGALGNLAALYFYSYVAMQIPTGILADTIGPRRLLSAGAIVACAGTLLFALSPSLLWAGAGRLLIGGSVAVAFVAMLKLASCWFPPHYYAMVSGMAVLCGIIGGIVAGTPLRLFMNFHGWRTAMVVMAILTFVVALVIRFKVRDYPHDRGYADLTTCQADMGSHHRQSLTVVIKEVFRYRNTWLLLVIPGSMAGSMLTFCGLWGVPFLTTHHGLLPAQAALLTSSMLVSMAMGGPICGWLSDRMGARKPLFIIGCAVTLVLLSIVFFIEAIPFPVLCGALVISGFSTNAMILTFVLAKESVPVRYSGTISGVINMGTMAGPMILQPAVGWVLDLKWQGAIQDGVRIYPFGAYQAGFALMIGWLALSLVLLLFLKETYCRQMA